MTLSCIHCILTTGGEFRIMGLPQWIWVRLKEATIHVWRFRKMAITPIARLTCLQKNSLWYILRKNEWSRIYWRKLVLIHLKYSSCTEPSRLHLTADIIPSWVAKLVPERLKSVDIFNNLWYCALLFSGLIWSWLATMNLFWVAFTMGCSS